jgi:hypothetical protein
MGNTQTNEKTSNIAGILPTIRYEVPFMPVIGKSAQSGGKIAHKSKETVSADEPVNEEPEEEINDDLTDNIEIEDDEMNELFDEEDLDIEDAEIDRQVINVEKDKKDNKSLSDDKDLDKSNDINNEDDNGNDQGESTPLSSSSPYGHDKDLAESSATMFPINNLNN